MIPMKTFVRSAAILTALLITSISFAQETADPNADLNNYVLSADYMIQELGVNEGQADRLRSIEMETNDQLRAIADEEPGVRNPKEQKLYDLQAKQIASVLTKDQIKRMDDLKREHMKERTGKTVPPHNE